MSGASIVNFEHISHFTVIIAEFEQINAGWAWQTIVLDNKCVFSNCFSNSFQYIVLYGFILFLFCCNYYVCWI